MATTRLQTAGSNGETGTREAGSGPLAQLAEQRAFNPRLPRVVPRSWTLPPTFAGISQLLAALLVCFATGCEYEGSDAWLRECAARGGHQYRQYIYKGAVKLCLSQDGRILEWEAP